jgi:gliding motility associated protien GldN
MKRIVYILIAIIAIGYISPAAAQSNGVTVSDRALMLYPHSTGVPEGASWTRELYRSLDLTKGNNGSLYYPVEPSGEKTNLFSLIFRLLASKKIKAYEYQLDGVEHFDAERQIKLTDILDRFGIYYEQKRLKGSKDSVLVVDNSDIPSAEVMSYFIKEVWYFDQRTSAYGSAVTALCPVIHRAEEFSSATVKLPMFWIDYSEIAPYLATTNVMASDYNNTERTIDDFFATRQYKGDIYKATNTRNEPISAYCHGDSAIIREQQRIEQELRQFESNLYAGDTIRSERQPAEKSKSTVKKSSSSTVKSSASSAKSSTSASKSSGNTKRRGGSSSSSSKSSTKSVKSGSSSSAAPKATVRRERR